MTKIKTLETHKVKAWFPTYGGVVAPINLSTELDNNCLTSDQDGQTFIS